MTGTLLLHEIKKILEAYAINAKPESHLSLRDLLKEMDRTEALRDLGCNNDCPACALGNPAAEPWENHCRIYAFLEKAEDEDLGRKRGNAALQREARALLESLKARGI